MKAKPAWKSRTLMFEGVKMTLTILIGAGLAQVWLEPQWAATIVVGLRIAESWISIWLRFLTDTAVTLRGA